MDELFAIWASWSPEAREKVLNVQNAELVNRIDASMRLLWTNEIKVRADTQGTLQSPVDPFDYSRYPLTSMMQFDGMVMQDQKVYKVVKWPKELLVDPRTVPAAVRSVTGRRQQGFKRVNPARWAQALLLPPPKSWSEFEQQLANLIEQLVLNAHTAQVGASVRAGNSNVKSGPSGATINTMDARGAELEPEDDQLVAERGHDGGAASSGGEEAAATELTGRAAKRARQRERRRMFKAAARAAGGDTAAAGTAVSADAPSAPAVSSTTSGPSGGAVRPSPIATTGAASSLAIPSAQPDLLLQNMRCAPPPMGVARGANSPRLGVGVGLTRPQGAGGGRRTDSPVWQPPGIWEPARINLSEADYGPLDADDLADAEAPQLQDLSGDEDDEPAITGAEAVEEEAGAAESSRAGGSAEPRMPEAAAADAVAGPTLELPDAGEPAKVVPEVAQAAEPAKVVAEAAQLAEAGEASLKEPVKVMEDGETNPWSGRPVSGPGSLIFGVGRGKPLGTEEAEGRFGDSFGSMGMGRGRALTPPPGLAMRKPYHRAPGGLATTWMPGPSIPEEDGDDPEKTMTEDVPAQGDVGGWLQNMQFADNLASALSARSHNSSWSRSQASFANTPSMSWSKTPSPPSTPINQRLAAPGRPGVPTGTFGSFAMPDAWQGAVSSSLNPGAAPMTAPIPLYVTVPIAMAHSCPHCGRAFAMPPDSNSGPGRPEDPVVESMAKQMA
mmetsp:Transcript_90542/g.157064  ORF Transcript_90542/g.157064 Transcript_90542/m.157064 type:complete len:726 (-) Transcript_90542:140-2317(-)